MADSVAIEGSSGDVGDRQLGAAADVRITEMRRLLDRESDLSAAEALSALRDAFPDAPLDERVRALKYSRH